jgi:hypothetical protein
MDLVLIIIGAVTLLAVIFFVGGYIASRRHTEHWSEHVAEAEAALEAAWAADRGWDRGLLDLAVRQAVEAQRPGWDCRDLHLILVDDRPGVAEDKAHFIATGGDGEARVVLARDASGEWRVDSVS